MVTVHEDQYTLMNIYHSVQLRMQNISDKLRENQDTHFIFNKCFRKSFRL